MLSTETIAIVKSTVPLLEEHGQAITSCFYENLFAENPDLKNIFNQVNQTRGEQPRALADAVLAYAQNIDNLEVLLPAVERIAHKHASLGIQANQYPIVGKNLLAAIQTVLGLPSDHPALTAWSEAYNILANIFIDAEETIYVVNEQAKGGWRGFREFTIDKIVTETPDVKSFYLKPTDGGAIPTFKGGQFVGLKANPTASEFDEIRQYSLSGDSGKEHLRITTKEEIEGLVSNHLHQSTEGTTIFLQAPTGVFTANSNAKKHVFIAGGVGITPIIGMMYQQLQQGINPNDILFIQCSRNMEHQVLKKELTALNKKSAFHFKTCFDEGTEGDHQGYLNADILQQWLTDSNFSADGSTDVYFCGPTPFMSALNKHAQSLGFSDENIHYETFGPTTEL
ncbi:hypothetical protein A9Q81_19220 [Gammaproteobacteria bacterium 42_54_T18]|nr:hypothetical protein A9Q81_19220 [Gammaproteobacteria bacterium 42_54_T18]